MTASTNPERQGLLWVLAAMNFVVGFGAFVVIGVLSPVADDYGISKASAGWIMTIYAIVYAVSSPLLVALSGRVDRTSVLMVGMGLFLLGALTAVMAPSFEVLLAARVIMALGGGLLTPVAASIAIAGALPNQRGRALAIVFGGITLAQAVGVPVGAWLGYAFGWRSTFILVSISAMVGLVAIWLRLPRGIKVVPASLGSLGGVLRSPHLMTAISFTAWFVGALYVVYTYLAPLLEEQYGLARDGVSLMLLIFGFGAVVGNALGGRLTDRFGPTRTLVALCIAQIVVTPILTMVTMPVVVAGIVVAAWSIVGWSFMVAQQSRLASLESNLVPVLFALNASAIYVGSAIGSAIGGWTIAAAGTEMLGPVSVLISGLAALSLLVTRALNPARSERAISGDGH